MAFLTSIAEGFFGVKTCRGLEKLRSYSTRDWYVTALEKLSGESGFHGHSYPRHSMGLPFMPSKRPGGGGFGGSGARSAYMAVPLVGRVWV